MADGGLGAPALTTQTLQQEPLRLLGQLAGQHQDRTALPQLPRALLELLSSQLGELGLNPEGVMPVGPIAVELMAQLVVGDLEGILFLPLEGLQIQLALERDLVLDQPRTAHHLQDQGQQQGGVIAGAFQADQGAVFGGFAAQTCSPSFHEIGQRFTTQAAAASAQDPSQQLRPTALAGGIGGASAADPELGREDRRARSIEQPERATALQFALFHAACLHAGTASSTKARWG